MRWRWLAPGLAIKRWLFGMITGLLLAFFGVALLANLQPVSKTIQWVRDIANLVPSVASGPVLIISGVLLMWWSFKSTWGTLKTAIAAQGSDSLVEKLYRQHKLVRGPKVVALGGGTGLSTLLRGLKHYTSNITAVVTVGDDGGSSGRLRTEQGIIPPGDIRNCLAALADEERLITELFQYRFKVGQGLEGHSFGNLFLTAMCRVTGDMVSAIKESSKVLNIRGRVLPATLDNVCLIAEMADGTEIRGESLIPEASEAHGPIQLIRCEPECPQALPEVLDAIAEADLIILGPGSLYTSVVPTLLVPEIAKAIVRQTAPKLYVCNIVTQPGETDGFSVADHLQALLRHVPSPVLHMSNSNGLINSVLVHANKLPSALLEKYQDAGSTAVPLDRERCVALNASIVEGLLIDPATPNALRHHPKKLAHGIFQWFRKQNLGHFGRRHKQLDTLLSANAILPEASSADEAHQANQPQNNLLSEADSVASVT
jgi:uncharacterized cofD-like protein